MNQDRDNLSPLDGILQDTLTSPGLSEDHGVNGLEVARVGGKVDLDLIAMIISPGGLVPEMVLHVAARFAEVRIVLVAEFVEDDGKRLLEEVCEDIEPAPVGHTEYDLFDAETGSAKQYLGKRNHQGLATLEREALASDIGGVDEVLETLGLVQCAQDPGVRCRGVDLTRSGLHPLPDPVTDPGILDVHVFDSHCAAVDRLHLGNNLTEFERCSFTERPRTNSGAKICLGESELPEFKQGLRRSLVV